MFRFRELHRLQFRRIVSQPLKKVSFCNGRCVSWLSRPKTNSLFAQRDPRQLYLSNPAIPISIRTLAVDAKDDKNNASESQSIPPFLVRVALVGTSVGILTPVFATAGVVNSWYKMRPIGPPGTYVYYAVSMALFGGIGSLAMNVVLPFLLHNGNLVFPFALSNGFMAAIVYASMEKTLGLQAVVNGNVGYILKPALNAANLAEEGIFMKMLRSIKITGPLIGILTAVGAPFLWPLAIQLCWGSELKAALLGNETAWWLTEFASTFLWPLFIPIGAIAGFAMHHLLGPLLTGTLSGQWAGSPWTQTAGPVLAAMLIFSGLYIALSRVGVEDLHWVARKHPISKQECSYNTKTNAWADGPDKADRAASARIIVSNAEWIRMQPVRTFLQEIWYEIREKCWGVKKPVKPHAPKSQIAKAVDQEQAIQLTDDLLRLRVLLDAESSRKTSPTERLELREERENLIELAKEKGMELEKTLFIIEAGVVALTAGTQKECDKVWTSLQKETGGIALDVEGFGKEYAEFIGHPVPGSALADWRAKCVEQTLLAKSELLFQCCRGTAASMMKAMDDALEHDVDTDAIKKGENLLRSAIRKELRTAKRAQRCREIHLWAKAARERGLDEAEIADALSKAAAIEKQCRQAVECAVDTNSMKQMERSIQNAKKHQVEGPWLEVAMKHAEKARQAEEKRIKDRNDAIFAWALLGCLPIACYYGCLGLIRG